MLSTVDIRNYRGFASYRAEGLARVNLFVGKNNSGKTALLEGLQLLTSQGDPGVVAEICDRRGELILSQSELGRSVRQLDIAHFFHGHSIGIDLPVTFQGNNGYHPVVLRVFTHKEEGSTKSGRLIFRIGTTGSKNDPNAEYRYPISREGGVEIESPSRLRPIRTMRRNRGPQIRFVGPESLNTLELATMWDEITITGQEVDVAETMRILDPSLESLHFLTGMLASGYNPSRGGIVVGIQGQEGRVPLGSMGDGMRRLMAIATSLAFTKNGCLFVDEIDTGLHYSVMAEMWKVIVSKAKVSNTQVFATTHSWDCIEGLSLLLRSMPEVVGEVAIHKIDRNLTRSIPFTGEAVASMIKAHIDPR